jgi:phosphopantothenoylcysteine decarboxylase/phosphopantothenate--cysteine ligase
VGRLPEPSELLAACEALLAGSLLPGPLAGLRVLVTAGGTREPIDSVRYIGNRSSGKMGFALAREAERRGAEVTIIAANVALAPPPHAQLLEVQTAAELLGACRREFERSDVLLMAAAVADFRPAAAVAHKLKKDVGPMPTIELVSTEDILGALAPERRPGQLVVGFAAEHGAGALAYAREKLLRKRLDAVVVNDISRSDIGFDVAENEVTIVTKDRERRVPRTSKEQVAVAVLDEVERLGAADPREGTNGAVGVTAGRAARV